MYIHVEKPIAASVPDVLQLSPPALDSITRHGVG